MDCGSGQEEQGILSILSILTILSKIRLQVYPGSRHASLTNTSPASSPVFLYSGSG
jgi:hypothetical protein